MVKRKRDKVEDLVGQLIQSELERELTKRVKRAKAKAVRQSAKLREFLQLPYVRDDEVVEAEVIEPQPADGEESSLISKKNQTMDSNNPGNHSEEKEMELRAVYTKDSKRYHVFQLEEGQEVAGSLYFRKDGERIPDQVVVVLKTPGENPEKQQERQ